MNTVTVTRESVQTLRKAIEGIPSEIETLKQQIFTLAQQLETKSDQLRELVSDHNDQIRILLIEELSTRNIGFCSSCRSEKSLTELKWLFVTGARRDCHSRLRNYSNPQNLCPDCYKKALAKSGWTGPDDEMFGGREFFSAWLVEERDGELFACPFGGEVKIERKTTLPQEKLAKKIEELNLPWAMMMETDEDGELKGATFCEPSETATVLGE